MKYAMQDQSRRNFMKMAAGLAGVAAVSGSGYLLSKGTDAVDVTGVIWRLNPGFRLDEIAADEVELFSNLPNGKKLQHRFQGLEADLLRQIVDEKPVLDKLHALAAKHNLPTEKCRQSLIRSLKEYAKARLIYSGEKMLVYKVEA